MNSLWAKALGRCSVRPQSPRPRWPEPAGSLATRAVLLYTTYYILYSIYYILHIIYYISYTIYIYLFILLYYIILYYILFCILIAQKRLSPGFHKRLLAGTARTEDPKRLQQCPKHPSSLSRLRASVLLTQPQSPARAAGAGGPAEAKQNKARLVKTARRPRLHSSCWGLCHMHHER